MGILNTLLTLIVSMIVVAVAFLFIDIARETAPQGTNVAATTEDVATGLSFIERPHSPGLIAGGIVGFVVLFIGYRFYSRSTSQ